MYAVVSSGGKQYRVEPGSTLTVERLAADDGASVTFDRVLLIGDGDAITVGTPIVPGATVSGTILGATHGPKIIVFKFKQKVKYRRRTGHRQQLIRVRIDAITANGRTVSASDETVAPDKAESKPKARRAPRSKAAAEAPATDDAPATEAATPTEEATPRKRRAPATAAKREPKADTERAPSKPATRRRTGAKAAKPDEPKE